MTEQLPVLTAANLPAPAPLGDRHLIPALIAHLGEQASWRYVEFFTANTRRAYTRASCRFLAWAEEQGLALTQLRPHDMASYVEALQAEAEAAAPSVKQPLAAILPASP